MAAGAVSDRMSHMRIVSSPEPVAIWYLHNCQISCVDMQRSDLPVRRKTNGKYTLNVTIQNHSSFTCPQIPNPTDGIKTSVKNNN